MVLQIHNSQKSKLVHIIARTVKLHVPIKTLRDRLPLRGFVPFTVICNILPLQPIHFAGVNKASRDTMVLLYLIIRPHHTSTHNLKN